MPWGATFATKEKGLFTGRVGSAADFFSGSSDESPTASSSVDSVGFSKEYCKPPCFWRRGNVSGIVNTLMVLVVMPRHAVTAQGSRKGLHTSNTALKFKKPGIFRHIKNQAFE